MSVFVLLRASLCLSLLIVAFSSSSSGVDFVPACHDICDVITRHTPMSIHRVLCLQKCANLNGDSSFPVDGNKEEKIWKTTDVETPVDGVETVAIGKRPNLLTSNFVRYGRDDAKVRKARRPIYIRVGRSGETAGEAAFPSQNGWNDQMVMEASKRASRFIRIGKSGNGGFEDQAKNMEGRGFKEAEFEKRHNILPSKYVRIGKRSDENQ